MRILVVGAGAVGGYFGARLAQAGRDVTFLVRPKRAAELRERGLEIESPHGDFTLSPALITADQLNAPFDVILLSLKGYTLQAALDDFAPAVGEHTAILPTLNGMRHMDLLTQRFGAERVLGGVCRIYAALEQGKIRQFNPMQQLRYGELDGMVSDRVRELDAAMQGVGFDAAISPDIVQDMWDKWVQLASLGAITCLFGGPTGAITGVEGGEASLRAIFESCRTIAAACGHAPSQQFVDHTLAQFTASGSPLASSMHRDMQAGAPVEVETILGDLVARGREHGADAALLQAAAVRLRVYTAARQTAP